MKKIAFFTLTLAFVFTFAAFTTGQVDDTMAAAAGKESPILAAKVATGELEPLEDRLPLEPKVLSAAKNETFKDSINFKIGNFGGALRMTTTDPNWNADVFTMLSEPLIGSPGLLAEDIRPNICKDFTISGDSKVFTFVLREGLRWSDGKPVTTEDVRFTYEDFLMNEKLTPTLPNYMKAGNTAEGEPLKIEIVDKYTFRIIFTESYEGFPAWLAEIERLGYTEFLKPSHYLKDFHIKYTSLDKLEPLIKAEGLTAGEWWALFSDRDYTNWEFTHPKGIGFPRLSPWIPIESTPTRTIFERNPYYFKVDSEGNQLPYIDYIYSNIVSDGETRVLKIAAGETDFDPQTDLPNLPFFMENAEKAGYRVILLDSGDNPANVMFNLSNADPVWQQVVQDLRFRQATSMAINREEIIDAIYLGFTKPSTLVPDTYDVEKANALLDEMGLTKRDADGYRLRPDGKPLLIPIEVPPFSANFIPVSELVISYWKVVGIRATVQEVAGALWFPRAEANELYASVFWNGLPNWMGYWPGASIGRRHIDRFTWPAWYSWWNTSGEMGDEPPAEVKRFFDLGAAVAVSPIAYAKHKDELHKLLYDNIFFIQLTERIKTPVVASKKLENVVYKGFASEASLAGEQLFFSK